MDARIEGPTSLEQRRMLLEERRLQMEVKRWKLRWIWKNVELQKEQREMELKENEPLTAKNVCSALLQLF